jgi:hypothetical protein
MQALRAYTATKLLIKLTLGVYKYFMDYQIQKVIFKKVHRLQHFA